MAIASTPSRLRVVTAEVAPCACDFVLWHTALVVIDKQRDLIAPRGSGEALGFIREERRVAFAGAGAIKTLPSYHQLLRPVRSSSAA